MKNSKIKTLRLLPATVLLTALLPATLLVTTLLPACSEKKANLTASLPDKFEGKTVELVAFDDSTVLDSAKVSNGKVIFDLALYLGDEPRLVQLTVDGRVKGYAVMEPGAIIIPDSMYIGKGTPLNDRFSSLMTRMDSLEELDDMKKYADQAEVFFNENKDNVLSQYFAVEWIRYADPGRLDSMLNHIDKTFAGSKRAQKAISASRLRLATAPGNRYTDFSAPGKDGKPVKFSSLVTPGKYTLVDFWASWCPYCIKELPELKDLYAKYHDRGLEIVGVAVRDKTEDTEASVEKQEIPWKVMYNTQRIPYEIYGFAGIPHHMLIGPDGIIISRDESAAQLRERISSLLPD